MTFNTTTTTTNPTTNNTYSSSSPQEQPDDISLFLRQLIHRSSSSSSLPSQPFTSPPPSLSPTPPMMTHAEDHHHQPQSQLPCFGTSIHHISGPSAVFTGSDRLVVDRVTRDTLCDVVLPSSHFPSDSLSSSVHLRRTFDNNNDYTEDNDYESEEGNEVAVVEETEIKQELCRNQSKRSRAAEVHNLSEKRRRSRINEKMKALQNLIPNSNKTDKASMLDEAIEYLKQLQLQVQMLSMRNGLNLQPMCLPGGQEILHPSQMGIEFDNNSSGCYNVNLTNALSTIAESSNTMLNLPNQHTSMVRPNLPAASTVNNSEAMSFGLESCLPSSFRPFQPRNSPQAVCKEQSMPHEGLVVGNIDAKSLVTTTSTRPPTFGIGDFRVKEHNSVPVEERMQQIHGSHDREIVPESISGQNQLISSKFSGLTSGGTQMRS